VLLADVERVLKTTSANQVYAPGMFPNDSAATHSRGLAPDVVGDQFGRGRYGLGRS